MAKPTVVYSGNVTSGTVPLSVTFTDSSTQSPTSYTWDFQYNSGTDSTSKSPTAVYNTPGTYTVRHTATNGSGTSTLDKTNYITASAPTLQITQDTVSGTAPLSVTFGTTGSTTTGRTHCKWDYGKGDGWHDTDNYTPTHVYDIPGTYTVISSCTYGTAGEFTHTHSNVITVSEPTVGFSMSVSEGPAPLTVTFTSTGTAESVDGCDWDFAFNGNEYQTTEVNNYTPTHTYTTPGVYHVGHWRRYGTAGYFGTDSTHDITVTRPLPVAAMSCNKSGAAPFTVTFGDAATGFDITDRVWHITDKHGSAIYTTASASYTFTKPGRYPVTYSVTNATGTSTVTEYIAVSTYTSAVPEASRIVDKHPIPMREYVDKTNGVRAWMAANDKVIQDAKGDMCNTCSYIGLGARCPMYQTDLCDKIRKVGVYAGDYEA